MKTLASITLMMLFFSPFALAQRAQPAASVSAGLTRANSAARTCPVDAFFRAELTQYYARTDFSDEGLRSGWYRVDHFLDWLKTHRKSLCNEKIHNTFLEADALPVSRALQLAASGDLSARRLLSVYLGGRYIADQFDVPNRFNELLFMQAAGMTSFIKPSIILVDAKQDIIPVLINSGIHEITHAFVVLKEGVAKFAPLPASGVPSLNELATFHTQSRYGLPVRADQNACAYYGARNLLTTRRELPQCRGLMNEYAYYLYGLVVGDQITKRNIFTLLSNGEELSVGDVVLDLIFLRDQRYFRADAPLSLQWLSSGKLFAATSDLEQFLVNNGYRFDAELQQKLVSSEVVVLPPSGTVEGLQTALLFKFGQGKFYLSTDYYVPTVDQYAASFFNGSQLSSGRASLFLQTLQDQLPRYAPDPSLPPRYSPVFLSSQQNNYYGNYKNLLKEHESEIWSAVTRALGKFQQHAPALPKGYI